MVGEENGYPVLRVRRERGDPWLTERLEWRRS